MRVSGTADNASRGPLRLRPGRAVTAHRRLGVVRGMGSVCVAVSALLVSVAIAPPAWAAPGIIDTVVGSGSCVKGLDDPGAVFDDPSALDDDVDDAEGDAEASATDAQALVTNHGDVVAEIEEDPLVVTDYAADLVENPCEQYKDTTAPTTATEALLNGPTSPVVNGDLVYFADAKNHRVRVWNKGTATATANNVSVSAGSVATVAGNPPCGEYGDPGVCLSYVGDFSGEGTAAISAELNSPQGIAVSSGGDLYISDTLNQRVRKVDTSGIITTVAGNGIAGFSGDGAAATGTTALTRSVTDGVTTDVLTNATASMTVTSATATFEAADVGASISGSGIPTGATITAVTSTTSVKVSAPATATATGVTLTIKRGVLNLPYGLAVSSGKLYIADFANSKVRKVESSNIATVAGNGARGFNGDGASVTGTAALTRSVTDGVTTLNSTVTSATANFAGGDVGASISGSGLSPGTRIISVSSSTSVNVSAPATATATGVSLTITRGVLWTPIGVALDGSGGLSHIVDQGNHNVRKVTSGNISTVAGCSTAPCTMDYGVGGDDGPATSAKLTSPFGVAVVSSGFYISDQGNHRVRFVNTSTDPLSSVTVLNVAVTAGEIQTVAGSGTTQAGTKTVGESGFSGDGASATEAGLPAPTGTVISTGAKLNGPRGVAVDSGGLYIADMNNQRIRKVDA